MKRVRFNSLCILPSQLESCMLDSQENESNITINDFILLKTLSKGAYGKVILARKKNTSDLFAIKVLEKDKMIEKNVMEYIHNEKNILMKKEDKTTEKNINNEFIVRGVYSFQSKKYLYMVMEFMKGGDFNNLLTNFNCFD